MCISYKSLLYMMLGSGTESRRLADALIASGIHSLARSDVLVLTKYQYVLQASIDLEGFDWRGTGRYS